MPWDIVGHQTTVASLRAALIANQVAHAYMFVGPQAIGKAHLARLFSQALLCERSAQEAPCGQCLGCRKANSGNHPDLHWLVPEGASFRIEQVRALQAEMALRPYEGGYKVCVLDDADSLTEQAQNSMLKVLEEPPGKSIMMLIVHNAAAILPTIQSRCQIFSMYPVPREQIGKWLQERHDIGPDKAMLLGTLSGGRPGFALSLDPEEVVARRERVISWSSALRRERAKAIWPIATELEAEQDLAIWLDMLETWFGDLWHRSLDSELPVVNIDVLAQLDEEAAGWNSAAHKALVAIAQARRQLARHANKRLVLDVMLMQMQRGIPYDKGNRDPF